ncbi:MAG: hypothetical protein WCF93_02815 [Candidatus Moraniibacteriota bacterium]
MSEQFHFENVGIEIPKLHPFELSEGERLEKYQGVEKSLRNNEKNFEKLSNYYFVLMDYFDSLKNLLSPTEYIKNIEPYRNGIIETAKCFTDCTVAVNQDFEKASDETWREDQALWHSEFEKAVKGVLKIKNQVGENLAPEIENALKDFLEKEHLFFNQFALMVACRETVLPDDREKVPVEKQ